MNWSEFCAEVMKDAKYPSKMKGDIIETRYLIYTLLHSVGRAFSQMLNDIKSGNAPSEDMKVRLGTVLYNIAAISNVDSNVFGTVWPEDACEDILASPEAFHMLNVLTGVIDLIDGDASPRILFEEAKALIERYPSILEDTIKRVKAKKEKPE